MERRRRVQPERRPDPVGHQRVDRRALVDLVEVRAAARRRTARRPVSRWRTGGRSRVVEQALGEVGRRRHVLEALLVLDADRVAAELVGDAHGGDVQPELVEDLVLGQLGRAVAAEAELHARGRAASRSAAARLARR